MAKRAEHAVKAKGDGSINSDTATGYVERIETLDAEIDEIMAAAREKCQPIKDDRKVIFKEAADNGIAKKPLAAVIRKRRLARRAEALRDMLSDEQAETYDSILHALGDLADLPLGKAALDKAPDKPGQPEPMFN